MYTISVPELYLSKPVNDHDQLSFAVTALLVTSVPSANSLTVMLSGLFPSWLSLSCQFLFTFIVTSGFTGISSSSSTVVFPSVAVAMFIMSFDIVSFCSVSKTALMSSCFTTYPTFNVAAFPASSVSIFTSSLFAGTVLPSKITSNESVTTTLVAL